MLRPHHSETYLRNTKHGEGQEPCCLCGKETAGLAGAIHVPINHETGEFVHQADIEALGDKVSLYPIGPSCAKKWAKEFKGTVSTRLRRSQGKMIAYDHQETR